MVLLQWSIQGTFIAAMMSQQYTSGPAIILWSAVVAWAATIVFPFIWGNVFLKKVYRKYLLKFHTMKKIMDATDKSKNKEYEERMDMCDEKIFGYFHWFYCTGVMVFWVCWPVTISLLGSLPRTAYVYNWYWYCFSYSGLLRCCWCSCWRTWSSSR